MVTAGAQSRAAILRAASTIREASSRAACSRTVPIPMARDSDGGGDRRQHRLQLASGCVASRAMSQDLAYLSATEALARFRDRSLSPVELAQALIARAAEVEPTVNALCVTRFEEALAEARAAEDRYMGKGEPPRPLEGICVGIKDEVPIAGHPCSGGSLLWKDEIATTTDPMAERILEAGGIP